jgi:spore coat polysaccharide biosynthesis protein SpsF
MRIGALIPVRLGSERLPGKALKLLNGRPVIYHLLDRIAECAYIGSKADIVICTTMDKSDDLLVEAVTRYGCAVFRGSTFDIIDRFTHAVEAHEFDAVVQANGDNPLSATEYMDLAMEYLLANSSVDVVTTTGLPLGCSTTCFKSEALARVAQSYRTTRNDTGFVYFFTKTGLCRHIEIEPATSAHCHPFGRLTLDYPEDLTVFEEIFGVLYESGSVFSLTETIDFLNRNPDLARSNLSHNEEYRDRTIEKAQLKFVTQSGALKQIEI